MSVEDFEGWMETLDIMAHPEEAADIIKALRNKDNEETVTLEEFKRSLGVK